MVIQPNTDITLYSGVDIGTCQQLAFSSRAKQSAYFQSKRLKQYVNCTVVKEKSGTIKVAIKPRGQAGAGEITGAELASANYMSFINPSFDNKIIYCYIVDYAYLNNETAEIRYLVDYWQTWMFDVSFEPMYIDREHLSQTDWGKIESNPYRSDVPQMITGEPLPTPAGYEKPFYNIQWWHDTTSGADDDALDGRALMHCNGMDSDDVDSMLRGDWNYWNVMLVQAPTDWSAFDITPEDGSFYPQKSLIKNLSDQFIMCYNYSERWDAKVDLNDSRTVQYPVELNTPDPITGDVTFTSGCNIYGSGYDFPDNAYDSEFEAVGFYYQQSTKLLWWLDAGYISPQTPRFTIEDAENKTPSQLRALGLKTAGYYSGGGTNVEAEYYSILSMYDIKVYPAGSLTTEDGKYTWSCKPKGCDVLLIDSADAWQRLATFYTKYGAVSQIVGIYGVPINAWDLATVDDISDIATDDRFATNTSFDRIDTGDVGEQADVRNKKLLTSPFSYYRVIAPDGQIKEFAYEKFVDVANGNSSNVNFRIAVDTSGDNPKIYLIPYKYDQNNVIPASIVSGADEGAAFASAMNFNLSEAMCIVGFPEISFNTDGYLTFLASEYQQIRANTTMDTALNMNIEEWNTNPTRNAIGGVTGALGSMVSGAGSGYSSGFTLGGPVGGAIGGVIGAASGLLGGTYNAIDSGVSNNLNRQVYENEKQKYREATEWVNGDLLSTDDPYIERFKYVKPAYANSIYTGGSGGVIRYLRGMGLFDFVGLHVQLRSEVLEFYDNWFDMYGYASGRCGIPHVLSFVQGSSDPDDLPHWVGNDGLAPGTTYVKTLEAKVEHAMMPVAQAISQMLNAGIRFKKGDLS